jgi:hypothetical protein
MGSRSTPEQILGNLFQFVINLRKRNISITRRTQALGSACVDTLRRDGWVIVRHDALENERDRAYQLGWAEAMAQENVPEANAS